MIIHTWNKPLVSIIIPVYNGSNYLQEAIDSALSQTYENIEVLVINDGSVDGGKTETIALSYGNKVRYFSKENGGVSTALNLGIKNMQGEYFSWLSHDDIYLSTNISSHMDRLFSLKEGSISVCKTGVIKDGIYVFPKAYGIDKVYDQPLDFWGNWLYACSMLIPKKTLLDVGCLNEDNRTTQDTELTWNLLKHSALYFFDTPLVLRRIHNEQGFIAEPEANRSDSFKLIKRTLDQDGIGFFVKDLADKNKLYRSVIYLFLASHYQKDMRKMENPAPGYILRLSIKEWDSFLNPCFYFVKFNFLYKCFVHIFFFIKRIVSKVISIYKVFKGRISV